MKPFVLLAVGFLLAVQFFAAEVQSSHYRGGTISYRPNSSSPYSVDFTFRLSFRRGAVYCDSSRVASRSLASTSNRWQVTRYYWSYSSSSYSGSANIYCSDFNAQEDWSEGSNSFTFTGSYGDDWWNVRITDGGNWIGGMTYSNPYDYMHLDARVNRTVSGAFNNSSPVSSLPLTVYVAKGIPSVIRIPVEDPDGDIVRCRNASYQECYRGMCTYFPHGVLDEGNCTLSYNGGGSVGQLFPIILKLEDFSSGKMLFDSSNSLGSVDLQFVVHIADVNQCTAGAHNCHTNATCINTAGSFTCQCNPGYYGNGQACSKIESTVTNYFASSTGRSGTIQSYTVPRDGTYLIQAGGARGGTHSYNYGSNPGTYYGGRGATMEGLFRLSAGTVLNIVVGQRGGNSVEARGGQVTNQTAAQLGLSVEDNAGTGGGGGSFVYTTSNMLLIAAGGGGGASGGFNGVAGQVGTSGAASNGSYPSRVRAGGSGGNPGACNSADASYHGGVGAGWNGQGCARAGSEHGERGGSHLQGWVGGRAGRMNSGYNGGPPPGAVGGFGGGGGGSEDNGASGGGGGYSGGGSGTHSHQAGGGGGSYCSGASCSGVTGGNSNEYGFVRISIFTCSDVCAAGTPNCYADANCTNTTGSFTYQCTPGYQGDGQTCSDVNECTAGTHNCHTDATCTNTVGSFTCHCKPGYQGNGQTCTGAVRIQGGWSSGRLQVFHNGVWGTVCDDGWTMTNTHVVCRQLGFGGALSYHNSGGGTGQIWLDDVQCYGSETAIQQCRHNGWGSHNCGHGEDVFVTCLPLECSNYTVLNTADRAANYRGITNKCDRDITPGWYRFMGDAGNTIATSCVDMYHCGTSYTGWMQDSHPTQEEGIVNRTACYSYYSACCYWRNNIRVLNCGGFYVYELVQPTAGCNIRYCGSGNSTICSSSPCRNNGTCVTTSSGYRCHCPSGYSGTQCETNLYPCTSNPCGNGGSCNGGYGWYRCDCYHGYTGQQCQTYLYSCNSGPCLNGGTCQNVGGTYNCSCPSGYTGQQCQHAVRIQGGWSSGRLQVLHNGVWGTVCDDGWSMTNTHVVCRQLGFGGGLSYTNRDGGTGQIWLDEVRCSGSESTIQQCRHYGWGRHDCSHSEDVFVTCLPLGNNTCASSPCRNNGTCVTTSSGYRCHCPSGYSGTQCENPHSCYSNPCGNGGSCVGGYGWYRCYCRYGYTGQQCQTYLNYCASWPCRNGGTCNNGYSHGYQCTCPYGFTGRQCETRTICASSPCRNNGTCVITYYGYRCYCPYGYSGTQCETNIYSCHSYPCRNGGSCHGGYGWYRCSCPYGYTGQQCQNYVNFCASWPCRNGGTCNNNYNYGYQCTCPYGFTGRQCETRTICASSPCRNNGTCVITYYGYRCYCQSGYSGTQCETNIYSCHSYPCRNGGSCHGGYGWYRCSCPYGYTGQQCQNYVNFCASWPCRNGGTCNNNNYYHGYQCTCPYGFTGRQCETRTICASRPCRNGGTCATTYYGYRCHCPYGYSGTQCETNLYSCHSNPCRNGGSCHGGYGWYYCSCPYGYTGQQCQTSLKTNVTCGETFMQIDLIDHYFPGLDWRTLHLRNTTCRATKTPYTMRLRAPLDGCGVTYVEHDEKIAFWNEVRNEPSLWPGWGGNLSAISRGENLIIPFYCEYGRDKIVSTSFSPSRKRVYASEGSFGNFTFTMDLYQSSSYSRPYSVFAYPVVVYPNQPLWVQYEVKNTNADLIVFAENCRATTSTDPDSFPQHVFLERGCVRDPTMSYWYNPYSNVQRFSIRSFRFVYSNTFLVYLHCELLVCHRNTNNSRCAQGCISGSRRRRETDDMDGSDTYGLSVGPMKGPNAKTETDKQGGEETSSAKNAAIGAGVGIAVVALLVGILVSVKMLHGRFKRVPPKEAPPPAIIMKQTVNSYEQHVMEDGERAEIEI